MSIYTQNVREKLKILLAPILMAFEENWSGYKGEAFKKQDLDKELDILIDDIFKVLKEEKKKLNEKTSQS